MSGTPSTSVIITYHNEVAYIRETIESALAQTVPVELIVVDDGSDERIDGLIESFSVPIQYLVQANSGPAAARNTGLSAARGDFIAFLDADDLWPPERSARLQAALADSPSGGIAMGYVQQFHSPELSTEERRRYYCPPDPMRGGMLTASLIRRESIEQVGVFATDMRLQQDMDWLARAREQGIETVTIPDVVTMRRIHGQNYSLQMERLRYVRSAREALKRQREAKDE